MKLPRSSVVLFTLMLIIVLSIERVFSLPVATIMMLLIQQPVLTEEESCVVSGVVGLLIAVVYGLPLAVGMGMLLAVTLITRLSVSKPHIQTRDGGLALLCCGSFAVLMHAAITWQSGVGFVGYFMVVNILARIWVSRRSL